MKFSSRGVRFLVKRTSDWRTTSPAAPCEKAFKAPVSRTFVKYGTQEKVIEIKDDWMLQIEDIYDLLALQKEVQEEIIIKFDDYSGLWQIEIADEWRE